jgi:hypothetical protein
VTQHCGHTRTVGAWLSLSHAVMCRGIPRTELDAAVQAGEVLARPTGWGNKIEVRRADVERRWPHARGVGVPSLDTTAPTLAVVDV